MLSELWKELKLSLGQVTLIINHLRGDIEKITFYDNVAIVMGGEKIKPQGKQMNAGKLVSRRFTNVWMYSNNSWTIIARQATIIKVE